MKLRKFLTTSSLILAGAGVAHAEPYMYVCQGCSEGTWSDGTFETCRPCNHPTVPNVASCDKLTGKATACNSGYELKNGACVNKVLCQAGYGYDSKTNSCHACGIGTYANASGNGQEACTQCSWSNSPGTISLFDSVANSHWVSSSKPCEWECNSGYTKTSDFLGTSCVKECTVTYALKNSSSGATMAGKHSITIKNLGVVATYATSFVLKIDRSSKYTCDKYDNIKTATCSCL